MYIAWTHVPCGHRNERATVDVCDHCGQRPQSIPEVRQHTAPVTVDTGTVTINRDYPLADLVPAQRRAEP